LTRPPFSGSLVTPRIAGLTAVIGAVARRGAIAGVGCSGKQGECGNSKKQLFHFEISPLENTPELTQAKL
jgi:hypothetical protein